MTIAKYFSPQACYGFLGLPLAMAALPVYVQIPAYYTTQLGLPLASTGLVLFFARMVDTLQDPVLGRMIDRRQHNIGSWLIVAALLLAMAFYGLWQPPVEAGLRAANSSLLLTWLGVMLIVAYTAHSMINIAYLSWGARLAETSSSATSSNAGLLGAAAWREGLGLVGVILASLVPSFIVLGLPAKIDTRLTTYAIAFSALLAFGVISLLRWAPKWQQARGDTNVNLRTALANDKFRRLLPIYLLNSLSVSIPATLALFFIADRIQAPQMTAYFLALYFFAGALGLPAWTALAKRLGTIKAWKLGMLLAIISFIGAALLTSGDLLPYMLVCIASGLALGADLALPPVLLAEIIPKNQAPASYYGVWTLLGKLALALSGLALPALSLFDYQPGQFTHTGSLVLLYAVLPCILKLFALRSLHRYPS
jgi:GPH family glycoside/pentoside/hexuronide:cation symporter